MTVSSQAEPVIGKVTSIEGKYIELDIGADKGIEIGDTGRVYYTVTIDGKEKTIYVAKFKITHTSPKSCMAIIEDKTGEVRVDHKAEVNVKFSELEVKSEPSGAEVHLNGRDLGITPLSLPVKPGSHQIRVSKEGFQGHEEEINLQVGDKKTVLVRLKVMKGSLLVRSEPSGAEVYVNERYAGHTPYEKKDLDFGSYKIKITREGYENWEQDVYIEAEKVIKITAKLNLSNVWTQKQWEIDRALEYENRVKNSNPIRIGLSPRYFGANGYKMDEWAPFLNLASRQNAHVEELREHESLYNYDIIVWETCLASNVQLLLENLDGLLKAGKFILLSGDNFCWVERGKRPSRSVANEVLSRYGMMLKEERLPTNYIATTVGNNLLVNGLRDFLCGGYSPFIELTREQKRIKILAKSDSNTVMAVYREGETGLLLVSGITFEMLFGVRNFSTKSRDFRILGVIENVIRYQRLKKIGYKF